MTASDTQTGGSESVCPRCGAPAGPTRWCESCGLNLRQQGALPTANAFAQRVRDEKEAQAREASLREQLRIAQEDAERQRVIAEEARRQQHERDGAPSAPEPAEPRPGRRRTALMAGAIVMAALIAGIVVLVATGGGKASHASGATSPPPARSPATQTATNASPVPIAATGSAGQFVRDWMVAAYSGDAGEVCAQMTTAALNENGGASECASSAASNNPAAVATERTATFWPTEAGNSAVVSTSGYGVPFGGSSMVHVVKTSGRWWINCLGYCNGPTP